MSETTPTGETAPPAKQPSTRRRHHTEMLVIAVLVVIASFVLNVGAGPQSERVSVAGDPRFKLPPLCPSKALFNIDCPGCGLTRGFVHLAHGRVHESLAVNRVAWLVALALVASIPYRILALYRHEALPLGVLVPRILAWVLITALIGNWILKQFGV